MTNAPDFAHMTPAARRMGERIPADLRAGTLRHEYTAMGDDGIGVFLFSDMDHDYKVTSRGEITVDGQTVDRIREEKAGR